MIPEWTDLDQEGFEAYRELHDANAELKRLNRQLRILRIKLVVAYMEYLLVMVTTAMFSIMVFASVAK